MLGSLLRCDPRHLVSVLLCFSSGVPDESRFQYVAGGIDFHRSHDREFYRHGNASFLDVELPATDGEDYGE